MSLVKTSEITGRKSDRPVAAERAHTAPPPEEGSPGAEIPAAKLAERLAAATEELAAGVAEASAAAEELRRSMEQIAAGAEEAAGSSQEQLASISSAVKALVSARRQAEESQRRTEALQMVLSEASAQITTSVRIIENYSERQTASASRMSDLEKRAQEIAEISRTVSRISDQTNLFALNAAIEAARAGEHGRSFAVVADEVRSLAQNSESSAKNVQQLSEEIQLGVRAAARGVEKAAQKMVDEANAGGTIVSKLDAMREEMGGLAGASREIASGSIEAERAASEAQQGAEQVAGAAEEQSAAAGEAQMAIQQQSQSLDQSHRAAQALARLAAELRGDGATDTAAEQVSSTAEELSAAIQELSGAAAQILAAVDQIAKGTQQQAAAMQQTSASLVQIEDTARQASANGTSSDERVRAIEISLGEIRSSIDRLLSGLTSTLEETRTSVSALLEMELVGRKIEKIVDAITLLAVQTTMLAVSGAVEAARAGEYGSGFSLVSNDIRNLAREASQSLDQVKDTVRGVLEGIASLRNELQQIVIASELELQNNRGIIASLERAQEEISLLVAANREITAGAESILAAAGETAAGARQIAAAAEQAGSAAREASAAASQQARGAEDLAAAIEEIATLAEELKRQHG